MASDLAHCAYCNLPVDGNPDDGPRYCCFGCRFASSVAGEGGEWGQARWTLIRLGIGIFFAMNVMVFTLVLWSRDVYVMQGEAATVLHELLRYLCLLFSLPVVYLLGVPLAESVFDDLRQRTVTSDLLLLIGVSAALVYSAVATVATGGHVYFEVVCMILLAVTLGRWLEATGKLKTTEALRSLEKLLPESVRRVDGGTETEVPLKDIGETDRIRVLPGERIPVDGRIVRNVAAVDEQAITGESQPVVKETGDAVYSGSLNLDGDLIIETTKPPQESAVSRLVEAVVRAAEAKAPYVRLADRLAQAFVPIVFLCATATFTVYWYQGGLPQALMTSLAVVLIACPCALAIATPLAIWAALGRASQAGVIVRNGDALSALANATVWCFDKTGTLTAGTVAIQRLLVDSHTSRELVLRTAAALAGCSTHPMASAVLEYADRSGSGSIADPQTLPGRGVRGVDDSGIAVYLGSERFMTESGQELPPELADQLAAYENELRTCVAWQGRVRGVLLATEKLRSEALQALSALRDMGARVVLLTGDTKARAEQISETLHTEFRAELLPEEKAAAVRALRSEAGTVVMVGDGINDAPALAAADVGIAMGCGADVSRETAHLCLLGNDLGRLPFMTELARGTVRTVRWNLLWVGIVLAMLGLLNPIIAAIAMAGSSLFVVTGSLRLAEAGDQPATTMRAEKAADFARVPSPPATTHDQGAIKVT